MLIGFSCLRIKSSGVFFEHDMNLHVLFRAGNLLTKWATVNCRRTVVHGLSCCKKTTWDGIPLGRGKFVRICFLLSCTTTFRWLGILSPDGGGTASKVAGYKLEDLGSNFDRYKDIFICCHALSLTIYQMDTGDSFLGSEIAVLTAHMRCHMGADYMGDLGLGHQMNHFKECWETPELPYLHF